METYTTLYQADIDGTYSMVRKVEVTKSFAKYALKENSDEYFKTFAGAKKEVLKHMEEQLNYWKEAVLNIRSLKQFHLDTE